MNEVLVCFFQILMLILGTFISPRKETFKTQYCDFTQRTKVFKLIFSIHVSMFNFSPIAFRRIALIHHLEIMK